MAWFDPERARRDLERSKRLRWFTSLHDAGMALATEGLGDSALEVWALAWTLAEPRRDHVLDPIVPAVVVGLLGREKPSWLDLPQALPILAAAGRRHVLDGCLVHAWAFPPGDRPGLPSPGIPLREQAEWEGQARALLRADPGSERGLAILETLVAQGVGSVHVHVLLAHLHAVGGRTAAAAAAMRRHLGQPFDGRYDVLGLDSTARLLLAGVLRSPGLDIEAARSFPEWARAHLQARIAADEEANPAASVHRLSTDYSQFTIEPKHRVQLDPSRIDFSARFHATRTAALILAPGETSECLVTTALAPAPAGLAAEDRARFSLDVEGDLYLRSISEPGDDHRIAVPPGHWDLDIAFVHSEREHPGARSTWHVRLYLTPAAATTGERAADVVVYRLRGRQGTLTPEAVEAAAATCPFVRPVTGRNPATGGVLKLPGRYTIEIPSSGDRARPVRVGARLHGGEIVVGPVEQRPEPSNDVLPLVRSLAEALDAIVQVGTPD